MILQSRQPIKAKKFLRKECVKTALDTGYTG